MTTRDRRILTHEDLIFNVSCKNVQLAYQTLNEIDPFWISPCRWAGFKWKALYKVY